MKAMPKLLEEQTAQLDNLNKSVDEFAAKLDAEVEKIKIEAKLSILKRSAAIWAQSSDVTHLKIIENELCEMRKFRALIDHEVRFCDRDELYLIEKNNDIEIYASSLSEFIQKTFEIPDKSCFQLLEFQRELMDNMTLLLRNLSSAKDKFLKGLQEMYSFLNPDQLNLKVNPVATFQKEKLLFPNEKDKICPIRGVIPTDKTTDALYFVSHDSSAIKQLDLKTSLLTEVVNSLSATYCNCKC